MYDKFVTKVIVTNRSELVQETENNTRIKEIEEKIREHD